MILTNEDIDAIKVALRPQFEEINKRIDELIHRSNIRLTSIEIRLDSLEFKFGRIPFENAYRLPPLPKK